MLGNSPINIGTSFQKLLEFLRGAIATILLQSYLHGDGSKIISISVTYLKQDIGSSCLMTLMRTEICEAVIR